MNPELRSGSADLDIAFSRVSEIGDALLADIDRLRENAPIFWSPAQRAWLVTSHDRVVEGFRGGLPLSGYRLSRVLSFMPEDQHHRVPYLKHMLPKYLISLDPPEHTRLRKLMLRAFSRKVAESYRPYIKERVAHVLEEAAKKPSVDFVEEVARRLTGHVILRLVGLGEEYFDKLQEWGSKTSPALGAGGTNTEILLGAESAFLEMRDVFSAAIEKRRANPSEDFISSLITAEEDGEKLTMDQVLATCFLTLGAGHTTTTNTIVLIARALARDSRILDYVRTHPSDIEAINMELMRVVSMSTAQTRMVLEDFEWGGQKLRKGDIVYLMIAGANRDPRVFENPQVVEFSRRQDKNMTFAPGLHHCIGHFLARTQLSEFVTKLVQEYKFELAGDDEDWSTSLTFRGLTRLPMRVERL